MRRENWIKWDLTSRDDPSTKWFLSQYKDRCRAYGFFIWVVELLYHSNNGWIELDDIFTEGMASDIGWTKEEVVEAILKLIQAKLFLLEANQFASRKVLTFIEQENELSQKRAAAGKKGGQNSTLSKQSSSKLKQNQANPIDKKRRDKIRIDKNIYNTHVHLTSAEHEFFKNELGEEVLKRCIDKLDSWIATDPTIKRKKNGRNAAACFRSWVINAVAEEQARASKVNPNTQPTRQTNAEKSVQAAQNILKRMETYGA